MSEPNFNELKRFVGKLLTNSEWDFNLRKIVEWLTDSYDVTFNNVTGSGTITAPVMGSSGTVFYGDGSSLSGIAGSTGDDQKLVNTNFEYWDSVDAYTDPSDGTYVLPQWYIVKSDGAGTAPQVDVNKDDTQTPDNKSIFSAELDVTNVGVAGVGMEWSMAQQVNPKDWPKLKGETVSFGIYVKAPVGAYMALILDDGVSENLVTHVGTNAWELVKLENITVSGGATKVEYKINLGRDNDLPTVGQYYFCQAILGVGAALPAYIEQLQNTEALLAKGFRPDYLNLGNGLDGDFTSSGNFIVKGEYNYDNFTLQTGHTMTVEYNATIRCRGKVTIGGNIDNTPYGNIAAGAAGVALNNTGRDGSTGGIGYLMPTGGSGGNGGGDAGRRGGRGGASGDSYKYIDKWFTDTYQYFDFIAGEPLGPADGTDQNGTDGTDGSSVTERERNIAINYPIIGIPSGGGSGASGANSTSATSGSGGDSGGGGPMLKIYCTELEVQGTPTIDLSGEDGDNGNNGTAGTGSGGGGGGGGGGAFIISYQTLTGTIPTADVTGGVGGAGATDNKDGGDGGDGGDGYQVEIQI